MVQHEAQAPLERQEPLGLVLQRPLLEINRPIGSVLCERLDVRVRAFHYN